MPYGRNFYLVFARVFVLFEVVLEEVFVRLEDFEELEDTFLLGI